MKGKRHGYVCMKMRKVQRTKKTIVKSSAAAISTAKRKSHPEGRRMASSADAEKDELMTMVVWVSTIK